MAHVFLVERPGYPFRIGFAYRHRPSETWPVAAERGRETAANKGSGQDNVPRHARQSINVKFYAPWPICYPVAIGPFTLFII